VDGRKECINRKAVRETRLQDETVGRVVVKRTNFLEGLPILEPREGTFCTPRELFRRGGMTVEGREKVTRSREAQN